MPDVAWVDIPTLDAGGGLILLLENVPGSLKASGNYETGRDLVSAVKTDPLC